MFRVCSVRTQKHVWKSLFRLWAEGGALVPCPKQPSQLQLFQSCLCSFRKDRAQQKCCRYLWTPGLPCWIAGGGDRINGISWDMEKPAKSLARLGAWGLCRMVVFTVSAGCKKTAVAPPGLHGMFFCKRPRRASVLLVKSVASMSCFLSSFLLQHSARLRCF